MKYNKIFDRWSAVHIVAGWILALLLYIFSNIPALPLILGPCLVLLWEYAENQYIKPRFFKSSPQENMTNIFSDVIWSTIGILLFTIPVLTL